MTRTPLKLHTPPTSLPALNELFIIYINNKYVFI
jgi:hypothetical protein